MPPHSLSLVSKKNSLLRLAIGLLGASIAFGIGSAQAANTDGGVVAQVQSHANANANTRTASADPLDRTLCGRAMDSSPELAPQCGAYH